jgi:hypothetical protein
VINPKVLSDPRLRQRYGIKPAGKSRLWIAVISIALICAWFIWSATNFANPKISSTLISFEVISDQKVSITYQVLVRDLAQQHSCTVVAKDRDKNTVGESIDQIPPGTLSAGKNIRTIEFSTRLPAVNATISSCR